MESEEEDGYHKRRERKKKRGNKDRRRSSSSSSSRESGHSHSKHRKKRSRRRSRSSSSRSRSRSRRSRHHHRKRSRSRSTSSDRESYKYQTPNNTVMVRGLAEHITENEIRKDLLKSGIMVKDIRLIRNRDTGQSRGFAFVEFHTVNDAKKWIELKKGRMGFEDGTEANLIYSVSKGNQGGDMSSQGKEDWYCGKCTAYNFKRREQCYKCSEPRPPEAENDVMAEASMNPTTTIMLLDLDPLTTEESVLQAFQTCPLLASMAIRSVRIPREPGTNLSKCVCYVESNTVADSIRLFGALAEAELEVDEVKVQAAYYKPRPAVPKSTVAAAALAAAQWTNSGMAPVPPADENDTEKMAEYSAKLYAKNDAEYNSYLCYYREYYTKQKQKEAGTDNANSPHGATYSSPISNTPRVEVTCSGSLSGSWTKTMTLADPKPSSPIGPDASRFKYDEASGYFFDPGSGYYYDPTNGYYYDAKAQQFMLWDLEKRTYVVTGQNSSSSQGATSQSQSQPDTNLNVASSTAESNSKPKKDKEKDGAAKNVAKEMEKWAKGLNQKKEQLSSKEPEMFQRWSKVDVTEPSVVTVPHSREPQKEEPAQRNPVAIAAAEADGSSSNDQSGDDSDSSPGLPDLRFLDKQKIACLLCKRQFSTLEVLLKHAKMSELHKQNLEQQLGIQMQEQTSSSTSLKYRDRAKERRKKFGSDHATAPSNSLKDLYMKAREDVGGASGSIEEPTKHGIKEDNIGNRMLQRMGWQAGQGLGKDKRGIKDPIKAQGRVGTFGLGLDVPGVQLDETDDRATKARKLTMARYMQLND